MQSKILLFSLIFAFIFLNVVAQEEGDSSDVDEEFELYKANLINAVQTLDKSLNTRDVRNLQRRGWIKNVWNNVVKPVLTNAAVKIVVGAVTGKRASGDNEALQPEIVVANGTQCAKDAAIFKKVRKAASQLCALSAIPNFKCL